MSQLLRNFGSFSTTKKLWLTGSCVALFVVTLAIANCFLSQDRAVTRGMLGHDFQVFYTAGTFVTTGRAHELYDLDKVKAFEAEICRTYNLEVGKGFGPIWNPPFFAWIFAPLAQHPYPQALNIWFAFSFTFLMASMWMLWRMLDDSDRPCVPGKLLIPLLILSSMPFIQAISHGQNTFLSLLILTTTVMFWRMNRALLAGMVGGLLFYKPQLGAIVALAMMLTLGRRAVLGLAITGTTLLLINVLTLPGTLTAFFTQMPYNLSFMQDQNSYLWERHVTFKGFWRLLIQGYEVGPTSLVVTLLTGLSMLALAALLIFAMRRARRSDDPAHGERAIAASICAMPLLMPFYFDYDLLLLAIPAALLARNVIDQGRRKTRLEDRWVVRCWTMLFLATMINAGTARYTHVNLTVPALTAVAFCMIVRAGRVHQTVTQPKEFAAPLRLAA